MNGHIQIRDDPGSGHLGHIKPETSVSTETIIDGWGGVAIGHIDKDLVGHIGH